MKRTTEAKLKEIGKSGEDVKDLLAIYKGEISDDNLKELITKFRKKGYASQNVIADMEKIRGSYVEQVYQGFVDGTE